MDAPAKMLTSGKPHHEEEPSLYNTDEFRIYCFKILPCSKRFTHDWVSCPFSHPGEKAKRRCVRTHSYGPNACPDQQKVGGCPRGDACHMTHNVFEFWLHPQRYRTQLCNDQAECKRKICFFAHSLEELRVPVLPASADPAAAAAAVKRHAVTIDSNSANQMLMTASLSPSSSGGDISSIAACSPLGSSSSSSSSLSGAQSPVMNNGVFAMSSLALDGGCAGNLACSIGSSNSSSSSSWFCPAPSMPAATTSPAAAQLQLHVQQLLNSGTAGCIMDFASQLQQLKRQSSGAGVSDLLEHLILEANTKRQYAAAAQAKADALSEQLRLACAALNGGAVSPVDGSPTAAPSMSQICSPAAQAGVGMPAAAAAAADWQRSSLSSGLQPDAAAAAACWAGSLQLPCAVTAAAAGSFNPYNVGLQGVHQNNVLPVMQPSLVAVGGSRGGSAATEATGLGLSWAPWPQV